MDKYALAHNRIRKLARLLRQQKLLKQAGYMPYALGGGLGAAAGGGLGALIGGKKHRGLGAGIGAGAGAGLGLLGAYLSQNAFGNADTGKTPTGENPPVSKPTDGNPPASKPATGSDNKAQATSTTQNSNPAATSNSTNKAPIPASTKFINDANRRVATVYSSLAPGADLTQQQKQELNNVFTSVVQKMADQVNSGTPLTPMQAVEFHNLSMGLRALEASLPSGNFIEEPDVDMPESSMVYGIGEGPGPITQTWADIARGLNPALDGR